jgi:hypothetical protein
MIEKVLIASMSKGQAPLFVVAGLAALMIWKMPPEDVSSLVFRLVGAVEHGYVVGYMLAAASTFGWFLHAKFQRKIIRDEMQRMSELRTQLQAKQTIHQLDSSE